MAAKTFKMTSEGKAELEKELDYLKTEGRIDIAEKLKVARSYGDLSENSEYEAAKDEQAFIEGRISTVETMIRYAEIVDNANIDKNEVALGKSVVFQEVGDDEEEEYEIVGTAEADPFSGKISNESPIAQALIGRKVGDVVKIPLPMGEIEVKIVDVN